MLGKFEFTEPLVKRSNERELLQSGVAEAVADSLDGSRAPDVDVNLEACRSSGDVSGN